MNEIVGKFIIFSDMKTFMSPEVNEGHVFVMLFYLNILSPLLGSWKLATGVVLR